MITFLKMRREQARLLPQEHLKAIQEELSEFLLREVLDPKGEHYTEDVERDM
jgi:hypothetical protein